MSAQNKLTKTQAKQALLKGETLRHRYFMDHEYIKMYGNNEIQFEDGFIVDQEEFWKHRTGSQYDDGWEIIDKQ